MNQYANKVFSAGMQITTVGTDSVLKQLSVEGRQCWMMIVDSAGQERFQSSLGAQFYRGADACVLTFDVYTHTHTHTHTHTSWHACHRPFDGCDDQGCDGLASAATVFCSASLRGGTTLGGGWLSWPVPMEADGGPES
jgi:hypothetical protein